MPTSRSVAQTLLYLLAKSRERLGRLQVDRATPFGHTANAVVTHGAADPKRSAEPSSLVGWNRFDELALLDLDKRLEGSLRDALFAERVQEVRASERNVARVRG